MLQNLWSAAVVIGALRAKIYTSCKQVFISVYSYSTSLVLASSTRMVPQAQHCDDLCYRDTGSLPILLTGTLNEDCCFLASGKICLKWQIQRGFRGFV